MAHLLNYLENGKKKRYIRIIPEDSSDVLENHGNDVLFKNTSTIIARDFKKLVELYRDCVIY